jgi:multidrug efflux pump
MCKSTVRVNGSRSYPHTSWSRSDAGLVTKNGILLVEFANQRRLAGLSRLDAAIDSAAARLRPILMTTLSTLLGVLPIALSLGGASGSRQSLGLAVAGGLAFSTLLTLYVVPAVYTYLSSVRAAEPAGVLREKSVEALVSS